MPTAIRSFAKINLGLHIGPPEMRADGFHELRTLYHTVEASDLIRVTVKPGMGIEIRCNNPKVPQDEQNTCWKVVERTLKALKVRSKVLVTIEKNLPLQGGVGAASSNAVAAMLGLERELKQTLSMAERLRIAEEVGSDVPLFLIGGAVLGTGRGEQVWPMADLPPFDVVLAMPTVGVPTPRAFRDWDALFSANGAPARLTADEQLAKLNAFSRELCSFMSPAVYGTPSGVPAKGRDRAEAPLLDLVRTGIENDFERVVFPLIPELREVKRAVEKTGAKYASLSGSGSTIFGLYEDRASAEKAAAELASKDIPALATQLLPRAEYWKQIFA